MKTFIFDIDGTLLDTEAMYMKALDQVLTKHGIVHTYDALTATFGITSLDALRQIGVPDDLIDLILQEWTDAIPKFQSLAHVYDGIEAMLKQLSEMPETHCNYDV